MVQIALESKGKRISKLPKSLNVGGSDTVKGLKKLIGKATGLSVSRVRLTIAQEDGKNKDVVLNDDESVGDYFSTEDGIVVKVRDLGSQIGWRTTFLLEYLGPLLIHPFFYYCQSFIYGEKFDHTMDQQLVFVFCILHFLKREYETAFVHHFSLDTMPLFNLFKNSGHYWGLSGVIMAYFCYAPPSTSVLFRRQWIPLGEKSLYALSALWLFSELATFWIHLNLSSLRANGARERKIPYGFGFQWVSVPNYFFEVLAWLAVALIIQNWSVWLFLVVATVQMVIWAIKKHKRYLKEFPNYPKNRKVMVPYIF